MDDVIQMVLEKLGVWGAFLIALSAYLIKKELAFQKERQTFLTLLEDKSKGTLAILEKSITASNALKQEIALLRSELSYAKSGDD